MGKSASKVKEEAAKQGAEDEKKADDALNALLEMGKKNLALFQAEIRALDKDDMQIPIDKIVNCSSLIKCGVSSDPGNIKNAVTESLCGFAKGEFLKGITAMMGPTIDSLLGNFSGSVSEKKQFVISVGELGGVYRIDYYMYAYQFTSKGLVSLTKNVLATSLVISSVKINTLNRNTVAVIIQSTFGGVSLDQQKKLLSTVMEAIDQNKPIANANMRLTYHGDCKEDEYIRTSKNSDGTGYEL